MTAFLLGEDFSKRSFRATADRPDLHGLPALKRGKAPPPAVLQFHWKMGSKSAGHVVWTDGFEMLISRELVDLLHGFSGWKVLPASLWGDRQRVSKDYYCLEVTGRCGPFLQERTVRLPRADRAFDLYKGLCFAPGADEPDFCMPESLRFVLVSERVRHAFASLACSNVELTPCDEVLLQTSTYVAILEKSGCIGPRGTCNE